MQLALPANLSALAHAYILESNDQTMAYQALLELAQSLLCQQRGEALTEPCQQCHSCDLFKAENHPDLFTNELEQTSIGVDEVRKVSEFLQKTAQLSGNQVVVLHQVEKMTENASNALLKTLEEPTAKSYLLLSCRSKSELLPTILSRCQFLQLPTKTKAQLQQSFSDLPDYLIGFANGAESKLLDWRQDQAKLEAFTQVYQSFIAWLKRQQGDSVLLSDTAGDSELVEFLLYLFSRRLYQLGLKQQPNAWRAKALIADYQQTVKKVLGINQKLALTSLLSQLRPLL